MGWKYEMSIWTMQVDGHYEYEMVYSGNNVLGLLHALWTFRGMKNAKEIVIR